MKTTLEIPGAIFRRAKATAAEHGIPFGQFVSEALAKKLETNPPALREGRLAVAGKLRHLHKETVRINRCIEREFEQIGPEDRA